MKIPRLSKHNLVIGAVAGMSLFSLMLPQPSLAQVTNNAIQDLEQERNSNDPFSQNNNSGESFGIFDLIHRAQLGNPNMDDYATQQNESLDAAAAAFRAKQRQRMQQQPATTTNTITLPQQGLEK